MLIYILIVAAILAMILGKWIDASVIIAVVLINAAIGFIQEGKAQRAMESIRGMLSPRAKVIRDSQQREIAAEELVPGDMVVVDSGDRVPADIRILEARNAQVDEANLTGESEPVTKQENPVQQDTPLNDRKNMAYSSTMLTGGKLKGIVVETGKNSEIGRIGEMVSGIKEISTPLLRKIDDFGKKLSIVIVLLSIALFLFGYFFRDFSAGEMLMIVVGLAVAAIPQGLPAIMTITLALGVQTMAKRNAIMTRLPAVETLGSVTVIFSDKTGTLTRNEMTVAKIALANKNYSVTGIGYAPQGEFKLDDEKVSPEEDDVLLELARAGMLSSDAYIHKDEDNWLLEGKPTEGAAVVLAQKAGLTRDKLKEKYKRIDVIPFESERRFMATLHETSKGKKIAYMKGAPERILEMCSVQRTDDQDEQVDKESWKQKEEQLADSGHRVLAIAKKELKNEKSFDEENLDHCTILGLIGIIDPPRQEAIEAVKKCQNAGIRVKMVTGDHALTARSIGKSLNIGDGIRVAAGKDIDNLTDEEFDKFIKDNDVFARSSPEHKLRMVQSLRDQGQIVAMTGDGVNDAPALKQADVGIAMGIKGSEASRQAADIVLADDNFATIERAVEEGRTIYDNLVKTILFVLPTNGAESLMVIASAVILFKVMPITPLQILWVNMVTAVTLGLSLAFEPPEEQIMSRPPRPPNEPIISGYLIWRIIIVSVLIAVTSLLLFMYSRQTGVGIEHARTIAVNTLVAGQLFYLFNSRFLSTSSVNLKGIIGNRAALLAVAILVVLQLIFTYFKPMQSLFGTDSIAVSEWGFILAAGFAVFIIVEIEKAILRKWKS